MDLASLSSGPGARKKAKRHVGRGPGSGSGKTAGRGEKGAKSRSGYKRRLGFEGGQMPQHRRLPKFGFRHSDRHPMAEVNVEALDAFFPDGADVAADVIVAAGLAKSMPGGVKVLGRGGVTKKLNLSVNAISAGARQKIEAAGGSVTLIPVPGSEKAGRSETAGNAN